MTSSLYLGEVMHQRLRPVRHRLSYRVGQGLFDLDELPALDRRLRLFGHNRAAPISFHDRDHGDGSGDLRGWALRELAKAGVVADWGALRILCMPRVFGFVFNPLSVWFCHDRAGQLRALLYEVNNTFGERHVYAIEAGGDGCQIRQACDKAFYVSPFLGMDMRYRFRIAPPAEAALVAISVHDPEGPVLAARFAGRRRRLSDGSIAALLLGLPFMTLKVVAAIHWEALRLWLKGVPFVPRTPPNGGDRQPLQDSRSALRLRRPCVTPPARASCPAKPSTP